MKKTLIFIVMAVVLALSIPVFAQEFPDVPTDHWAYDAIQQLAEAGIIQGYPDGTFGGKRAMTRYEFAEALAKAIPVIESYIGQGGTVTPGTPGTPGPQGPQGPKGEPGVTPEQIATFQRMANEFKDELAALGVDVDQLKRDVADLQSRVAAVEKEQKRVVFTGEANVIGRATKLDDVGSLIEEAPAYVGGYDRDGRPLQDPNSSRRKNLLHDLGVYNDYAFNVKGRLAKDATLNATISAGDYMSDLAGTAIDTFTLWNLNLDAKLDLGAFGKADVTIGRFPFQLTPLTLKFVDPDTYVSIDRLDSGDYVVDGAKARFGSDKMGITLFAAKAPSASKGSDTEFTYLMNPALMIAGEEFAKVSQLAGARATFGSPDKMQLGVTYYQTGQEYVSAKADIYGADLSAKFSKFTLNGEYAKSDADDDLTNVVYGNGSPIDDNNQAINARLAYDFGNLALGGGYTQIEANYFAPGSWSRVGSAVNLVNVKGATADLNFKLNDKLALCGNAMFLEPDDDAADVRGRMSIYQNGGPSVSGYDLDKITAWKAGLKYGFSSKSSFDFGYEEVKWEPVSGSDDRERYYTFGFGHAFNPNSSLRLMYQVVDYDNGSLYPYGITSFKGGVATAQVTLKY